MFKTRDAIEFLQFHQPLLKRAGPPAGQRPPEKDRKSVLSRSLFFARNFLRYPMMQGSVVPSSRFLVNGLLRKVDWNRARLVVEFGPGVGTITQEILRRMDKDAILIAVELNPEFVTFLRNRIPDPRLKVVHGSAADVRQVLADFKVSSVDYIISSLPYAAMNDSTRREIMEETRTILCATGSLLFYQYTTALLPYLRSSFSSVQQEFQFLNIPPALIFNCTP